MATISTTEVKFTLQEGILADVSNSQTYINILGDDDGY